MASQTVLENTSPANNNMFGSTDYQHEHYRSQSDANVSFCPVSQAMRVLGVLSKYHADLHRISNAIQNDSLYAVIFTLLQFQHNLSTGWTNPSDTDKLNTKRTPVSAHSRKPDILSEIVQSRHKVNEMKVLDLKRLLQRTFPHVRSLSEKCRAQITSSRGDRSNHLTEKPPHHTLCTAEHVDTCFNNDLTNKHPTVLRRNHLLLPRPVIRRTRSKSPAAQPDVHLKYRNVSPVKSQRDFRHPKNIKTAPVTGRLRAQRKAVKSDHCKSTYCLSAWGEGGKPMVQLSCSQDDLSILRKAVFLSSRHSSFIDDCSLKEITSEEHKQASAVENIHKVSCIINACNTSQLHIHHDEVTVKNSQVSSGCNVSSQDGAHCKTKLCEVTVKNSQVSSGCNVSSQDGAHCKTKLCEEYTSSDSSNSHHTRSIWSKFSVNESERTSIDYIWESTTLDELQSTVSKHDSLLDRYRQFLASKKHSRVLPAHQCQAKTTQSSPLTSQEQTPSRLESALILSELSMRSYNSIGLNLLWHQLGHIPTDSRDHFLSQKAKTETKATENTLKQPRLGSNPPCSQTPFIVCRPNSYTVFRNLRLVRSISSPNVSVHPEERARQYLVLSQVIQMLYSPQKTHDNQNNFCPGVLGSSVCSSNHTPVNIRKRMMKILCESKKRDIAFRSYNDRPFYVWKWRLFLFMLPVLLIVCAVSAYVATLAAFQ